MNKRQKLVQQQFLNNEQAVIKRLEQVYKQSLKDIDSNIEKLMKRFDPVTGDLPQSAVYQIKYQKMLKGQIEGILNQMQTKQYLTVSDYLSGCYEDGFIGSLFDLHGQGIPLTMPIDQTKLIRAVQLDSKISKGLYNRLGEDVDLLKKKIIAQVSRSISSGTSFAECARQLSGYTRIGYNNAVRIARTEGHRIQTTAAMDTMYNAKERGADVVKQWDATLDGLTRESHAAVDGEIRELDESFSNGLDFPGDPAGGAAEVVNCRCAVLQRARWALGDSFTKWNNISKDFETFESPASYDEFKKGFFSPENKKYMDYVQQMEDKYGKDFRQMLDKMTDREYTHYSKLLTDNPVYNKQKKSNKHQTAVEISGKSDILTLGDYVEFENYLMNEYGINVHKNVKKLDFIAVKESTAGVDYVMKEFPQAHDMFAKLYCDNSGIMSTDFYGGISFNPQYYGNYSDVVSQSGNIFNDITTAVFSNGSHEAGHLLEAALIRMNGGTVTDWNNCTFAQGVVNEAWKNAKKHPDGKGKKVSQLINEVSDYASENRSECLAECVSDYSINGDKAALLSKEVWKILKRELG